jgi:hypothetical protein
VLINCSVGLEVTKIYLLHALLLDHSIRLGAFQTHNYGETVPLKVHLSHNFLPRARLTLDVLLFSKPGFHFYLSVSQHLLPWTSEGFAR